MQAAGVSGNQVNSSMMVSFANIYKNEGVPGLWRVRIYLLEIIFNSI